MDIEHGVTSKGVRFAPGQNVKYVPNHRSFGAFIKSDQMRDVTVKVAQDIALSAAAKTPESEKTEDSTGFHSKVKKSFKVRRKAGLMKVSGNLRVKVEVFNNVDGSALIEFGGRGLPRLRVLGAAGAEHGDFKPEGGPS